MQNGRFVHLHVHSEYSLLDGSIKIKNLVKELSARGDTAAALTDHDAMHGALEFFLACRAARIHGILGYELNIHPFLLSRKKQVFHLVVLAENEKGYANLVKLCTIANTTGQNSLFANATCVSWDQLAAHSEGLICLTSCLLGELSQLLLENNLSQAMLFLKHLISVFGRQSTFVELIDNGIPEQGKLIPMLVDLAHQCQIGIVATADVHYLRKTDKETHMSLLAIKHKLKKKDVLGVAENAHFHLATCEEMQQKFAHLPEALANTRAIAERCQLAIDTQNILMPSYRERPEESTEDCLVRLAHEGLQQRKTAIVEWQKDSFTEAVWQTYQQRLEYELSVILKMNFAGYFLIVQDFINWAKKQGISVGPGRGSAAGSLVTYALRITNIDPLRFNLLFERFLNPERISMPDIDTDFCQERREEVLRYVYKKYGLGSVSQIVTFGRMMARNAIKNLARISGWSFHDSNEFVKLIPDTLGTTLEQAFDQEPRLRQRIESDERAAQLWEGALQVEGTLSSLGVHAAGVIISDRPLDERCPLIESEGQLLTQFENKYAEKLGFIKFDFLGLKTLTVIENTVELIRKSENRPDFNIEHIDLEDPMVYQTISTAHVTGLFQLESGGMRKLIADLKPSCFSDIVAILALFRPGPLGSGMVEDFVKRKHGITEVSYPFAELEPILADTYGVIVYQEQVQKIASVLASYSLGEADLLRRAMGKKDRHEMEKQKNRFVSGATQNGHDGKRSEELFDLMAKFAEYGFNKSHTVAYGLVTYQTAWLKTYYPVQFMASIMTYDLDHSEKIALYVRDCKRMGITVWPPSLNHSCFKFVADAKNYSLRFGLGAIKGLGEGVIELIVAEREKSGKFTSMPEFIARVGARKLNKKAIESLVKSGACDDLTANRAEVLANAESWLRTLAQEAEREEIQVCDLFSSPGENKIDALLFAVQTKPVKPWFVHDALQFEYETLGFYMTGHPAHFFRDDLAALGEISLQRVATVLEPDSVLDHKRKTRKLAGLVTALFEKKNKEGAPFLVIRLDDGTAEMEATLFARQYEALEFPVRLGEALVVECKLKKGIEQGSVRGIVQGIARVEQKRAEQVKRLVIQVPEAVLTSGDAHGSFLEQLVGLLQKQKGHTPVELEITPTGQPENLKTSFKVRASLGNFSVFPGDSLIREIEHLQNGAIRVKRVYQHTPVPLV